MSRYIDADKLKIIYASKDIEKYADAFNKLVDNIPTADVRENVKGEWIDKPNREFCFRADFKTIECNQCGYNMPKSDSFASNYCPNCGADMRPITALSKNAEIVANLKRGEA